MSNRLPKFVTAILMVWDGQDHAHCEFCDLIREGKLSQDQYDQIEDAMIDFVREIITCEGVDRLQLAVFGENDWKSLVEEWPRSNLLHRLDNPNMDYPSGWWFNIGDLNDFFRLGIRDAIGFGATSREGHFFAFMGDGCIHVGHQNNRIPNIPKSLKQFFFIDDVSGFLGPTDYYDSLL